MLRLFHAALLAVILAASAAAVTPVAESIYHDVDGLGADSVALYTLDPEACANIFEARGSLPAQKFSLRDRGRWGLVWGDYPTDYYSITLQHCSNGFDEQASPFVEAVVTHTADGRSELIQSTGLYEREGVDTRSGAPNTVQVVADTRSGLTTVSAGSARLHTVISATWQYAAGLKQWGIVTYGAPLQIQAASTEILRSPAPQLLTDFSSEAQLDSYFATHRCGLEGYWEYLDRANDPDLALPGGRYTLALVADGNGGYDIIYVSGAEVNASDWHPGMLRGHLLPTQFAAHFTLIWVDADMRTISTDLHADYSAAGILALQFPLYSTTLRFARK